MFYLHLRFCKQNCILIPSRQSRDPRYRKLLRFHIPPLIELELRQFLRQTIHYQKRESYSILPRKPFWKHSVAKLSFVSRTNLIRNLHISLIQPPLLHICLRRDSTLKTEMVKFLNIRFHEKILLTGISSPIP